MTKVSWGVFWGLLTLFQHWKVLFDGASQPVPVALRHLRLATAAGVPAGTSNGRGVPAELEPRRRGMT